MSSHTVPARGPLTDALIDHLETELAQLEIHVGDGVAPEAGGWDGQPQVGRFISYVTVRTGEAVPRERDTVAATHASWNCTYTLRSVGAVREQCDYTADMARRATESFQGLRLHLGDAEWHVTDVRYTRLGPVDRNDSTDPPTWECIDTVSLWIDRSRARR